MEEKSLIIKCQTGDKDAFQQLITIYHPYIYKFLVKISENEHISEDLTQETFIKVIRSIEKFDLYGKAKFSTYVMTIAKNCYIDYLRKHKNSMTNLTLDESISIEDVNINLEQMVIDKMDNELVMDKLENLSEQQRMVIKMKYIEGLTLKEIGDRLELEPKTVKSRIHNGIVKLRAMFERED